ncbi:MAG: patatin-like phospholipase family protein [Firmicutes bacterium]|nr:patatin-like phospholipase family protein [Bacillota bacterium]
MENYIPKKNDWALVLAGGGGNGAFEIGVWRALREFGDFDIKAAAGSSVGALNAALFACSDLETAEKIWYDINPNDVVPIKPHRALGKLWDFNKKMSICSTTGLRKLISSNGLLDKLRESKTPCFASCTCAPQSLTGGAKAFFKGADVSYFDLRGLNRERATQILLATSAIPFAFPQQKIDNNYYMDGDFAGRGDCMPVQPLYDMGFRNFIVVHLDRYKPMRLSNTLKSDIDTKFLHIYPPREFDHRLSILNFKNSDIKKRIEIGYQSAKDAILNQTQNAAKAFVNPINQLIDNSAALKDLRRLLDRINIPLKVIDGEHFWNVIAQNKYFKLEQHIATHHARLLEIRKDGNYRIAWGSKNAIENALDIILRLSAT